MNISTNPTSFKGSYLTTQNNNPVGEIKTFTNDLKVIKKTQQRVQNGKITNPSTYWQESYECTTCTVDDKITITTRTSDANKNEILIAVKNDNDVVNNLSISQDGISDASKTELVRAIENFVISFRRNVDAAIQKVFNESVLDLLTKK